MRLWKYLNGVWHKRWNRKYGWNLQFWIMVDVLIFVNMPSYLIAMRRISIIFKFTNYTSIQQVWKVYINLEIVTTDGIVEISCIWECLTCDICKMDFYRLHIGYCSRVTSLLYGFHVANHCFHPMWEKFIVGSNQAGCIRAFLLVN